MWVPAAISGVASLANLVQGANAAKQRRNEIKRMQARNTNLANMYKSEADRDYLTSKSAKASLNLIKDAMLKRTEAQSNKLTAAGGTNEAKIASKAANADAYNKFVKNLSARGEAYRDRNIGKYINVLNRNDQIGLGEMDRVAANTNAAGHNIANALSASMLLLDAGKGSEVEGSEVKKGE